MSENQEVLYNVVHRLVLQIIIARNVIAKQELEDDIVSKFNSQHECHYALNSIISLINNKLRDMGLSISETMCDDGETYFCFVNTTSDVISNNFSLGKPYLDVISEAVKQITSFTRCEFLINRCENIGYRTLCESIRESRVGGINGMTILEELFSNHWLYHYVKCRNGDTVIAGPRLTLELGNWLVNELSVPECPICMDPVIGGLHCPHSCGSVLHRGCAYRSLVSMESNDDVQEKGVCPGCQEKWIVDVDQLTDFGRIYKPRAAPVKTNSINSLSAKDDSSQSSASNTPRKIGRSS